MIRRPPRSTRTDTLFPYTTLFRSGLLKSSRYAEQDQYSQFRCGDRAPPRTSKACAPDTRTEYFPKIRFQYCAEFGRVPARLQKRSYPSMPELLPNTPVARPWAPSPPCGHPCGTFRGRQARRTEVQRSEVRRVGEEFVSKCRSRWPPEHYTKK